MTDKKHLSNLIGAFATTISARIENQISDLGGRSLSHEAALVAIYNHPNETIDVLSKVLALTHSGAVRVINALEKEEFVERIRSVHDARSVVLHITAGGSARVKLILKRREDVTFKLLEGLNEEHKQSLLSLLEITMGQLTVSTVEARRICRLCDEGACRKRGCPVENSVT